MSISTITIGANNYTAYASVAEADAFLAVDPVRAATWTALTTDQKGTYLIAASRRLDLLSWAGERTGDYDTQTIEWPRTGVTYPDGSAVSTTEVPVEVEEATAILAGSIAIDTTNADAGTSGSNVKSVKAGSAAVEFFKEKVGVLLQDETAWQRIWPFLGSAQGLTTGMEAFGTDGDNDDDNGRASWFENSDTDYELTDPYA